MCFHSRTQRLFYKQNSGASFVNLMATFSEGDSWQALEAGAMSILGRSRPNLYSGAGHPQHSDGKKQKDERLLLLIFLHWNFHSYLAPLGPPFLIRLVLSLQLCPSLTKPFHTTLPQPAARAGRCSPGRGTAEGSGLQLQEASAEAS